MSSDRDERQKIINANKYMEAMFGDRREARGMAKPEIKELKPVRAYKRSGNETEAQIQKAIMQVLHRHPKVARVWRQNSGTFKQSYGGKDRYVRANTAQGMSDIMGILKDGRTLAIEVKSATGTVKAHQHEFLNSIATAGGIAFVARSVSDVLTKLERA